MKIQRSAFLTRFFLVLFYLLFGTIVSYGQGQFTTQGKDFRLAFGNNYTDGSVYQVRFVSPKATTITMTFKNGGSVRTFNLSAGQVYTYQLATTEVSLARTTTSQTTNNSIRITSTEEIAVFAINLLKNTTDATNVLPITNYGLEYYHMSYKSVNGNGDGYLVVANENNTQVSVNGVVKTTLSEGQVYAVYSSAGDMTGTKVTTTKPVAYFVANGCVNIPTETGYCDCLFQQLSPTPQWGNYFLIPVTKRGKDRVRILASQNSTTITQVGGTIKTGTLNLNAGQWVELEIASAQKGCYITANRPVAVTSYLMGSGNFGSPTDKGLRGDPAMAWIPPIEQKVANVAMAPFVAAGSSVLKYHYAIIIAPTAYKSMTTVQIGTGTQSALSGGVWVDNTASGYSYYDMPLSSSNQTYVFENSKGLTILAYGTGEDESYYYLAAASARQLDPAYYVNDIHFQDMQGQSYCDQAFTFKTSIQYPLRATNFVYWYIDGVEYTAARDRHTWTMPAGALLGTHTIKLVIYDSFNNSKEVITTFTVLKSPVTPSDVTAETICYGAYPVVRVGGTTSGLTYKVYTASSGGTLVGSGTGTGGAINITCTTALTGTTTYYVAEANAVCESARKAIAIPVRAAVTAGTIVANQTKCYGDIPDPFMQSVAPSGGTGSYKYQWQSSSNNSTWTNISGGTGITYTAGALTATTYFRRIVTDNTCTSNTATSTSITVTVLGELKGGTIGTNQTICYDVKPATLTSSVVATGGSGTFAYQWQLSTNSGLSWSNIIGATLTTYSPTGNLTETTQYRRMVTSGTCNPAYSNTVTVTVLGKLNGGIVGTSQSICFDTKPTAFTNITSASGGANLTYQWESSPNNSAWTPIASATAATYTVPSNLTTTTYYRRKVTSTSSCGTEYSNTVTVTVLGKLNGGIVGTSQSICFDTKPTAFTNITSASGGANLTYQWESSPNNSAWTPIASATAATYTVPSNLTTTTYYRRKVTSTSSCGTEYSNTITVTVNSQITFTATPTNFSCYGSNDGQISFNVIGGTPPYRYSIDEGNSWQSNNSFTGLFLGHYWVMVKDANSCISDKKQITISQPAEIILSTNLTHVLCNGGNTGQIDASASSGGSGNFEFNINGGSWQASGMFTGLTAGNYTIRVRDANATNCIKESTVVIGEQAVVLPVGDVSSPLACPNLTSEILIANSKNGVIYKVYSTLIGGSSLYSANGNGGTLSITVGIYTSDITLYIETETTGGCISITRVPITIKVRESLANYPDIRMQICTQPNRLFNLASYLDTSDFKSINWFTISNGSPIPVSQEGTINTGGLDVSKLHVYNYKIENNCYPEKTRKFYIQTITDHIFHQHADTVVVCKDFAESINLNQILGLDANGTWSSDLNTNILYPYVKQVTVPSIFAGARILDGTSAYAGLQGEPFVKKGYKSDPNAILLEFSYTNSNSCWGNKEFKLVVIITSFLL